MDGFLDLHNRAHSEEKEKTKNFSDQKNDFPHTDIS